MDRIRNNAYGMKCNPDATWARDSKKVLDQRGKWFPVVEFNRVTATVKNGRSDWTGEHAEKIQISEIRDFH